MHHWYKSFFHRSISSWFQTFGLLDPEDLDLAGLLNWNTQKQAAIITELIVTV